MTVETQTTIEPGDLETAHVRCSRCGVTVSFAVSQDQAQDLACPHCNVSFTLPSGANVRTLVRQLRTSIEQLSAPVNPFSVRFGLTGEQK